MTFLKSPNGSFFEHKKRQFICTDKERNVILQGASEYMSEEEIDSGTVGRSIGLAMVPGKHIVKMEIRKKVFFLILCLAKFIANLGKFVF